MTFSRDKLAAGTLSSARKVTTSASLELCLRVALQVSHRLCGDKALVSYSILLLAFSFQDDTTGFKGERLDPSPLRQHPARDTKPEFG